jgi:3-isopropylmalate/(R)-2-methylmalate dehydratase small subunit
MLVEGKALKYGDNIDTDVILPAKYLVLTDPKELSKHAMEGLDPSFTQKIKGKALIVAGKNFGCGSSREQAPLALKHSGIGCILAESFARIFYRNSINIGLPVLECKGISKEVDEGDYLIVDVEQGKVENRSKGESYVATQLPSHILRIIEAGGLVEYLIKVRRKGETI